MAALAAQPACQILPPQIPGYRRYCPYTRDPGADGRWRGPDINLARRLVALERVLSARADGSPWLDRARQTIAAARAIEQASPDSAFVLAYDAAR